jgi:membrane fusion protein (multidrug efflux system)
MSNHQNGIITRKIILALIAGAFMVSCSTKEQQQSAPPEIKVVEVQQQSVPLYYDFVGQIYGEVDIPIRARVSGWVESINFQEGSRVKKGQLLYTIDNQPFLAQLSQQQSKLAEAKTAFVKAEADLNRYIPLAEKNAVSKSDLDAAQASYDAALSYVDAAEASVELARIELSYCNIRSPINGLIGKTKAKVGEFVGQDPNPVILNTVSSTDKVRVEFFLTESDYLILARELKRKREIENDSIQERQKENLQLLLSDGSIHPNAGTVDFVDREVDPETGSLLVQASFDNPDGLLRPGQFARVRVKMETVEDALLLPQRCFSELQGLFSVTMVNDDNKIEIRQVEVGPMYKDFRLIRSGLKVGDKVVFEGLQKVRPGMVVNPELMKYESQYKEEIIK